jgi:predicted metal-dependent peptidase
MIVKNIHEKLLNSIQTMLIDTKVNLPFYGEFNLHVNFHEQDSIGTCAVNMTTKGMNFFYSPKFLENMSQREVNFITLHEDFHLLFNHPRRTVTGQYDHKLSNIAQDMIINHVIWEDINHNFVEIPKDKEGKNMALFVPKEYSGKLIFEELYEWLKEKRDEWQKEQKQQKGDKSKCQTCGGSGQKPDPNGQKGEKGDGEKGGKGEQKGDGEGQPGEGQGQGEKEEGQGQGGGNGEHEHSDDATDKCDCPDCGGSGKSGKDSDGKPSYGPYGKNPSKDGDAIDTWSVNQIFDDMEKNQGQYLDVHVTDEIPEEMRDSMIRDVMDRLQSRGLTSGNIETTLNKLRKKRKDYLKEIKRSVSNMIFGHIKHKTIVRPNRRQIAGLKGNRKIKSKVNVILDTSGSMGGASTFERVLSYVYRNDIEINMIQGDTEVKWVENFKSKKKLESMKIHGLGGTILTPSVNYVVEHFNQFNTVILSDGYTDTLDLSKLKGKVLVISVGTKIPISRDNGKVKQIILEETQ